MILLAYEVLAEGMLYFGLNEISDRNSPRLFNGRSIKVIGLQFLAAVLERDKQSKMKHNCLFIICSEVMHFHLLAV